MKYFLYGFKKCTDFSSRTPRKEYWIFMFFSFLLGLILESIDYSVGTGSFSLMFQVAIFLPAISMTARRLHDTGRTGWWQLIALIPLLGLIILLIFLIQGSHDRNSYGPGSRDT
ncbi:MAG: DUF805 domain-containing protein [Candidatus Endonucleobacter bathymodioli]|uniref:DUF805 domain-containing protein n=1 Tax=Candidatus Endonucleibacter bathymodioli TaxID=539814 RepID=A0AA90P028_9GAMM|nr:DUF805 domain-containing protein [Candidatus Endonucleobacter bathymodioli]